MADEVKLIEVLEGYVSGCHKLPEEGIGKYILYCIDNCMFSKGVFLDNLSIMGSMRCKIFFTELGWEFFKETYERLVIPRRYDKRNERACLEVKDIMKSMGLGLDGKHDEIIKELVLADRYLHQRVYDVFRLWFTKYC